MSDEIGTAADTAIIMHFCSLESDTEHTGAVLYY